MEENNNCIFCENPGCKILHDSGKDNYKVDCRFCGAYFMTEELGLYMKIQDEKALIKTAEDSREYDVYVIQGAITEHNLNNHTPFLTWGDLEGEKYMTIDDLLNSVQVPVGPAQKMDKFLENIVKKNGNAPGKRLSVDYDTGRSLCYAGDSDELRFVLQSLESGGYLEAVTFTTGNCLFQLSIHAWNRIEELKSLNQQVSQAFIACCFDDDHEIFSNAIGEAIKMTGFDPMLIKHKHYPETIMAKALGEIKRSRFVVVDLTKLRKSVFFEAGFALGRNIEVIFVVHESDWVNLKEFYSKNYNIKQYKDERHLKELVETAIRERIN